MKKMMMIFAVAIFVCFSGGEALACTGLYVGSEVSADGTMMIGRSADGNVYAPCAVKFRPRSAESEPGRAANGFTWVRPAEICQHWSVVDWADEAEGSAEKNIINYENFTANEHGLAVTSAVTAYVSPAAAEADAYVENGVCEEIISVLLAERCRTAREAVEFLGQIVEEKGSAEPNIILIADKNEAWYMEIYTGHQYAAIKLPSDKMAVFGNEFMLEVIDDYRTESVVSKELYTLPQKKGFAKYDRNGRLNVFETYVGQKYLVDFANLRTFRGRQLFMPAKAGEYAVKKKYPLLFSPEKKVTLSQAFALYRDRYEGSEFAKRVPEGKTYIIGKELTVQAHVMRFHRDLPGALGTEAWVCFSNAAYAPFVPLSSLQTDALPEYKHIISEYAFDDKSASVNFKMLNALAFHNREKYGRELERCWRQKEAGWEKDWAAGLKTAAVIYSEKSPAGAAEYINTVSMKIQKEALAETERLRKELFWYIFENCDTVKYKPGENYQIVKKPEKVFKVK